MAQAHPFMSFFTPAKGAEQEVLFGFVLPTLPISTPNNHIMQLHVIKTLWHSEITAVAIRFVTLSRQKSSIYLFCRLRRPPQIARNMFIAFGQNMAYRIQQIFNNGGYQLQPIIHETNLFTALVPFQLQAVAEIRRREEIFLMEDTFTEYEMYSTYAWEWSQKTPLKLHEILRTQEEPGLISMYLEPTKLFPHEERHLEHATSPAIKNLLSGSRKGKAIYHEYRTFTRRLEQPYLLRISLASPDRGTLEHMGQKILEQTWRTQATPILQFPQSKEDQQAAVNHLRFLEAQRWGDIGTTLPGTARLRYLVDGQGAAIGFHLPVEPKPITAQYQHINILLILSNPYPGKPLLLENIDRITQETIKRSDYRDNITLKICHAATIDDLSEALLQMDFQIVHIVGHGIKKGLILIDKSGEAYVVPQQALVNLLKRQPSLRCAILEACYTLPLGKALGAHVPFTIAMDGQLNAAAAQEFARGFYTALGSGKDIDIAYDEGCSRVQFAVPAEPFQPKLFIQSQTH